MGRTEYTMIRIPRGHSQNLSTFSFLSHWQFIRTGIYFAKSSCGTSFYITFIGKENAAQRLFSYFQLTSAGGQEDQHREKLHEP